MKYEIDKEFEKAYLEALDNGDDLWEIPAGCTQDEKGLIVLPNGKYLPEGIYKSSDGNGCTILYEPIELRCDMDMLANLPDE